MKKKWLKSNGFTLAELLIVVAIIAVLVAISIPIFTTQLEKAREATDLSDVRSAYAEVMMAAITDDTTATYSKDSTQTIHKSNGLYSVDVYPLHQEKNDWQGTMNLNVGGVSSSDSTHWIGTPQAKGSCEVSYNPQGDAVTFNWLGKSNAGSGSGTDTGNGGNNNGGNGSSTGGGSTPAPTPNPGNGGGSTGGNNNQGNTGTGDNTGASDNNQGNTGGNTGGNNNNQGNTGSGGDTGDSFSEITNNIFSTAAESYPSNDFHCPAGRIYSYKDKIYITTAEGDCTQWINPDTASGYLFFEYSSDQHIYTQLDVNHDRGDGYLVLNEAERGTIYFDGKDYYIRTYYAKPIDVPPKFIDGWIKIDTSSKLEFLN